ncbi:hypothetical protein CBR_g56355 [Chara braunii]|uniref:Uncharacterized protein n=1 Tax=Chara braunii TaxID=69332 RepID=A0A388MDP6_CHABU|nr:hypothetical protein CBR_g56355 [Chara braunii]|eukprot:GBG92599.1 hypothetical protein CBR_g56355 [Chara braunii]
MHNLAAGYHRDYSFIKKLRCWRQVFECMGSVKSAEVKLFCLKEAMIPNAAKKLGAQDALLQCAFKPKEIWDLMCKIMNMWQKGEVKGQKLKPATKDILKSDQDLESSESEDGKKSQRGKRLERAAAKEQEMALLHPRVQMQGSKVPMVVDDMPAQHWIAMGSMAQEHAVPILLEMEKKFQLVKQVAYVCKAFAVGVGCADFKEAEKQYPLHTKKDILEKFVSGVRRGQKSIPALDGHLKRALDWKSKERRLEAKEALHAFRSTPLTEPFVDWTEVKHENDAAKVKIINNDIRTRDMRLIMSCFRSRTFWRFLRI